jgi:hypothetical protein
MKCFKLLCMAIVVSPFLSGLSGCGGSGNGSSDVVHYAVCHNSSGYEPYGTICDDGLCHNGTNSGMCDGAGNCVVDEHVSYTGNCMVFLSSSEYDGALGGLAGADLLCQELADEQGIPGTFKAWLSDSSTSAAQRLTHSAVPYVDVWGRRIADDWQDLTEGELQIEIRTNEKGFDYIDSLGCNFNPLEIVFGFAGMVWTNTRLDGSASGGPNCMDWTDNSAEKGLVGFYCLATQGWTDPKVKTETACGAKRSLYCFQQ